MAGWSECQDRGVCPSVVSALPLFFPPFNSPHSFPGLARCQTERGAAARDFRSFQGEVGATPPQLLSLLPSVPLLPPCLPCFYIPLLSPPLTTQEDFDSEQLSVLASCLQELFKGHFRGEVLPEEITEE